MFSNRCASWGAGPLKVFTDRNTRSHVETGISESRGLRWRGRRWRCRCHRSWRCNEHGVEAVDALAPDDLATVILFDSGAEAGPRSTTDRASLTGLVADAEVGSGVTRFGPALKLAEGIFEASDLTLIEAVLISDFQRAGVESAAGVRFPEGTGVTPVRVGEGNEASANVSVAGVLFEREYLHCRIGLVAK